MQDQISLKLEPRDVLGKQVKHLRREGVVPAVIHDHGKPSVVVQGNRIEMLKVYQQAGRHHAVKLTAGDRNFTALIRKADFDPKKNQLRHLVFNAVHANEKVEAEIPVHPRYGEGNDSAPAERAGLVVLEQLDEVQVKATPDKLPDFVEYDAEKLVAVGDHVTVADLIVPEGVEVLTEAGHAVATVFEPSALQAANEELAGAETEEEEKTADEVAEEGATEATAETEKSAE
ncbi:MAG TPA: 50S ribosomal protein L25 [Candidatus Saccharimonadales bacterium]|nr:50S ribosomal protein L25 [Candidatus Saccharimonadales bacterium]